MSGVAAAREDAASVRVTLLFTDLAGSTEILGRMGDDAAQAVLRAHFKALREASARHAGEEIKSLGDGLMIAFPSAAQAVASALEMQRRVDLDNSQHPDRRLGLRIGINTGDAISEGSDLFGMAVVVAKRLCDRAGPGQIVVSDHACRLVEAGDELAFGDLGALSLKGIADPVRAWELPWRPGAELSIVQPRPEPSPAERVDAGDQRLVLPPVLADIAEGRFVGRSEPLDVLHERFGRARIGERRMVALAGEPGIGKTRLAGEAAARAHGEGAIVLYGRCDEEPLMAYQPFVEALGHFVANGPADQVLRATGSDADSLARVLPQLRQRLPAPDQTPPADPETERFRLFDAVTRMLAQLAEDAPVVLVLDDLHWADKPTLLLVRYVMRSPAPCPLLVIGTYRDSEITARHPLTDTVADLRRARVFERLQLDGLTEVEVAALVTGWAGQHALPGLASALWRETEGHPFFVEEVLRHLLETGAIYERRGRLSSDRALQHIPDSVKDVIESRLGRLEQPVRDVLAVASVVGREFRLDLLEGLSGVSLDELLRILEEAVAARLVEHAPGAHDRYGFTHALVRDVLYDGILPARRARMHERLGRVLEELPEADRDAHVADLAYHYFQAVGDREALEKAIAYSITAGVQATAQLAYEEAAGHYERALEGLALRSGDERRECEVLLAIGNSRWNSGDFAGAREAFRRAAELADRLGLVEEHARAALGFGGRIGFRTGVVDPPLIALLERSLELLGERDGTLRAMVMAQLAEALAACAPPERRESLCRRAEALARRLGDKPALAFVLQRSAWALWSPDNVQQRLLTAREVVELANEVGDTTTAIEARLTLLSAQLELGFAAEELDGALGELGTAVAESRQPYSEWLLLTVRTTRALYDRPLAEAERCAWQALEAVQASQHPAAVELFGTQMTYIRYLQGRLAEMHASLKAYAELFSGVGAFRASMALAYAEMGQVADARRELAAVAADDFAMVGRDMLWFTTMNALTVVCSVLGERDCAARLYELLKPHADGFCALGGMAVPSCSFERHLGMLAATCRRFDDAARHFDTALGRNERIGSNLSVTLTKLEYARMLVARGAETDGAQAGGLLREALAEAEQLGLARLAQKARALEAEIGQPQAAGGARRGEPSAAALALRAARAGSHAKALLSTRTRIAVGRRFGDAPAAELERLFGSPLAQRALLTSMVTGFQPRMAFGFRGEIQLEFVHPSDPAPRPSDWWTLEIKGKWAAAHRRMAADPAVTLHVDIPTFVRLFGGELNPIAAWLDGQLQVEGDVLLAPRMIELFGGVKPFEDLSAAHAA